MKQLTKDEAIKLYESGFWERMDFRARAEFQFFQDRLCMPFGTFHEPMEKTLKRSVWTHEFSSSNREALEAEFVGDRPAPTFAEIVQLIPEEKRVLLVI